MHDDFALIGAGVQDLRPNGGHRAGRKLLFRTLVNLRIGSGADVVVCRGQTAQVYIWEHAY